MRSSLILTAAVILTLLVGLPAGAQPYRTVGPDGRVTYSDTPPTAASARSSGNSQRVDGSPATGLPYGLTQTAQKYPVMLYTSQGCAPCNAGRNLLVTRGIPFTEKTVSSNDDIAALQKIAGSANLPLLTIGNQQISGFQDSNWSEYLSAAGYPQASQLPGSYHRPPATPLAALKPEAAPASTTAPAPATPIPTEHVPVIPPSDPNNPAGIQF